MALAYANMELQDEWTTLPKAIHPTALEVPSPEEGINREHISG